MRAEATRTPRPVVVFSCGRSTSTSRSSSGAEDAGARAEYGFRPATSCTPSPTVRRAMDRRRHQASCGRRGLPRGRAAAVGAARRRRPARDRAQVLPDVPGGAGRSSGVAARLTRSAAGAARACCQRADRHQRDGRAHDLERAAATVSAAFGRTKRGRERNGGTAGRGPARRVLRMVARSRRVPARA